MTERDLVVGELPNLGNIFTPALVVLPRSVAVSLAERVPVLRCTTWGEVRDQTSPAVYQEVLELAGYSSSDDDEGVPLPTADEPFDAYDDIPALANGDWPEPIQLAMHNFLPNDVVELYGDSYQAGYNGTFVELDAAHRAEVVAELERLGFTCTDDQTLIAQLGA